jgi:hypothetical protein
MPKGLSPRAGSIEWPTTPLAVRRFGGLSDAKLLKVWTAAYDKMEDGPADDVAQEALTFDLDAEYEIRGMEPPYQEWLERRWAGRASADKTKR